MFTQETYIKRRLNLRKQIQSGVILLLSNNESPMNYASNTYRYRQDSSFTYFFGLQLPKLIGVIDIDENKDFLFGDNFTIDDIIWIGDQPTIDNLAGQCGIDLVKPLETLTNTVKGWIKNGKKIHFLPPYRDDSRLFLSELLSIDYREIKENASEELIRAIVSLRSIKSSEEIKELEKICDIGVMMHTSAMKACQVGKIERELAGLAEGIALSRGNGVSFPVILSQNGETLHNNNHDQILTDGRLLLMDMGAESTSGYCSDYSRTIPVNGKFSPRQKEIYEIVLKANLESIAMARPGIRYLDVHMNAVKIICTELVSLGLMKGDPNAAAEEGAAALFMPHGLGHMLGLDVHDMENFGEDFVGYDQQTQRSSIWGHKSLRCGRTTQPGFVLTVEPGIYFIPQLISIWETTHKFTQYINYEKVKEYIGIGGIRIEDDVLITETGCHVLGKPLPKMVEEIEQFMK